MTAVEGKAKLVETVAVDRAEAVEQACQVIYREFEGYWPSNVERAHIAAAVGPLLDEVDHQRASHDVMVAMLTDAETERDALRVELAEANAEVARALELAQQYRTSYRDARSAALRPWTDWMED